MKLNELVSIKYGIIPACDLDDLLRLENLVNSTCDLDFIAGYKIGMSLVLPHGMQKVVSIIRKHTELPILYDHQKFGSDIPDICGGKILKTLKESGVSGLIIFPQSGIETLKVIINSCHNISLVPIVGGEMTHKGYLVSEGGYIEDKGPEKMYLDAACLDVQYFVVPGNRLERIKIYRAKLQEVLEAPKFLFPGIGKGQGGDILDAFNAVKPCSSYAIVGRGIYAEKNSRKSARYLWENVRTNLVL